MAQDERFLKEYILGVPCIRQLQQFPSSGILGNDPGIGKWFPRSNSRSKKIYVEKRKKYISSATEIYKNRLKV